MDAQNYRARYRTEAGWAKAFGYWPYWFIMRLRQASPYRTYDCEDFAFGEEKRLLVGGLPVGGETETRIMPFSVAVKAAVLPEKDMPPNNRSPLEFAGREGTQWDLVLSRKGKADIDMGAMRLAKAAYEEAGTHFPIMVLKFKPV